jgi:hypothetical protein
VAPYRHEFRNSQTTAASVPAGAPSWVTAELIAQTMLVWQPYYENPLTIDDALAMIMSVAVLWETFAGERRHETICRPGPRQQP